MNKYSGNMNIIILFHNTALHSGRGGVCHFAANLRSVGGCTSFYHYITPVQSGFKDVLNFATSSQQYSKGKKM